MYSLYQILLNYSSTLFFLLHFKWVIVSISSVRKAAILNSAPLPPSRQRRGKSFNSFRGGAGPDEMPGLSLMKQTMKMAKAR